MPAPVSNGRISFKEMYRGMLEFECVRYIKDNDNTITMMSTNGGYLYTDSNAGLRIYFPTTLDRFWHYKDNKFWQFKSTTTDGYEDTSSEYKYYLEIGGNNNYFTDNHVTSPSISDTNIPPIYIFVEDEGTEEQIFIKNNDTWVEYSKVYQKINDSWVEQDSSTWSTLFNANTNYRKMN